MQKIIIDDQDIKRFECNPIVKKLLEIASNNGYSLNEIGLDVANGEIAKKHYNQLNQLIGCSVDHYCFLDSVSKKEADKLRKR